MKRNGVTGEANPTVVHAHKPAHQQHKVDGGVNNERHLHAYCRGALSLAIDSDHVTACLITSPVHPYDLNEPPHDLQLVEVRREKQSRVSILPASM